MRILLVNWNDRENPHAGGAEIHLHEIFGRLAGWGHTVDLVASGWPGGAAQTVLDGMRVHRSGGRHSFALRARAVVGRLLHTRSYDILVEDINKLPLYLTQLTELPFCVIVPHLFGATAFAEASWPIAAVVWAAEQLIPRVYRRAAFHAISDSTRDDLVRRGSGSKSFTRASMRRGIPRMAGRRGRERRRSCTWGVSSVIKEWRRRSGPWPWLERSAPTLRSRSRGRETTASGSSGWRER